MTNENDKIISELPNYVLDLLKKVAKNEKIENLKIDLRAGSNLGDGYFSNLVSITLSGIKTTSNKSIENNSENEEVRLHLLCKMLPESEEFCKEMNIVDAFEREVFIYSVVLPAMEQFQKDRGITADEGFFAYPKCYESICNINQRQIAIIMEDLRGSGFKMWPRQQPIDIDHVELVFQQLARFHAISFAMRDQDPLRFARLSGSRDLFARLLEQKTFLNYFDTAHKRTLLGLGKSLLPKRFEKVKNIYANAKVLIQKIVDGTRFEPYSVLMHADCWNNNILFKYKQPNSPDEVKIIDWQFSNYNSPAFDVYFYLFSATDKALRDKHYHRLIKMYHDTLSHSIRRLGSDPNKLFPFGVMMDNFKLFGEYIYIVMPITIDLVLADPDNMINFDDFVRNNNGEQNETDIFKFDEKSLKIYHQTMTDITNDLFDLEMLQIE